MLEKTEQAHVRLYACERAQQSMESIAWCLHGVCLLNVKARAKRAREKNGREYKYPLGAYEIYGWKKYRSVQHDDDDDDAAADDDGGDLDQLGNSSEDERKEEKRKLQLPSVCARTINV